MSHRINPCWEWRSATRGDRVWRLFLSGLLCVPGVVLLAVTPPHDRASYVEHASFAGSAAIPHAEGPAITISLPPTRFLAVSVATDLDGVEAGLIENPGAAPAVREPVPSHPKRVRVLHARKTDHHEGGAIAVGQAAPQRPRETFWARLGRWFNQHEAPRVWSPGTGEGAG